MTISAGQYVKFFIIVSKVGKYIKQYQTCEKANVFTTLLWISQMMLQIYNVRSVAMKAWNTRHVWVISGGWNGRSACMT